LSCTRPLIGVTFQCHDSPDANPDQSGCTEAKMNLPIAKRWTKICLRTLHLLAVAGVGGGILFGLDQDLWRGYWWLAMISGGLMMLVDIISNPVWVVQVRGLVIFLKLILLVLLGRYPLLDGSILAVIIVISAVISHAPGSLRYYSVYHGRQILSTSDTKG
jgi:hypothetical protein